MEKELNIAAILKDKPNGTKLWSPIFGECVLSRNDELPEKIWVKSPNSFWSFDEYGKLSPEGELMLFPSKQMQDWSRFAWKKGDVLINGCGFQCIFKDWASDDYMKFNGCYSNSRDGYEDVPNADTMKFEKAENYIAYGYIREIEKKLGGKLNLETLEIEQTKQEFKDGDIVVLNEDKAQNLAKLIAIYNSATSEGFDSYVYLNVSHKDIVFGYEVLSLGRVLHYATDSEKQQFFSALAKEGKRWNPDTKQIEDLPKKCEFEPFQKVLVRDSKDEGWGPAFFVRMRDVDDAGYKYKCLTLKTAESCGFRQCIPYNEETKHLLGTTDDWEGGKL